MLAADTLVLQSAYKQKATALKDKEFQLHHSNNLTVGTQSAVLAGLDITLFIEFSAPDDAVWQSSPFMINVGRALKLVYYTLIVAAFCANISVVAHTTSLSVLGGSLALRGPDGSMMTATDVLYNERPTVFYTFGIGLACTVLSVMVCLFIFLPWEVALVCWCVTTVFTRRMYKNHQRVSRALQFDESQTVDFKDIFKFFPPAQPARRGAPHRALSGPAKLDASLDNEYDESSDTFETDDYYLESTRRLTGNGQKSVKRRGAPYAMETV
ncbi:hypothetical protein MPSEU_000090500 [Mayamaea pseudoterrestris]|nr:hypothetical protein MPSEU_000090500 [Mayamaea pseudoterrestris]